jgi:hypothetical protein
MNPVDFDLMNSCIGGKIVLISSCFSDKCDCFSDEWYCSLVAAHCYVEVSRLSCDLSVLLGNEQCSLLLQNLCFGLNNHMVVVKLVINFVDIVKFDVMNCFAGN